MAAVKLALEIKMFYAFESVNNTVVAFDSLEQAQAWIDRVVPATDRRGAPDSSVNMGYSEQSGWTAGDYTVDFDEADAVFKSAAEAEADYAEAKAMGCYDDA